MGGLFVCYTQAIVNQKGSPMALEITPKQPNPNPQAPTYQLVLEASDIYTVQAALISLAGEYRENDLIRLSNETRKLLNKINYQVNMPECDLGMLPIPNTEEPSELYRRQQEAITNGALD